ncbi:hypothetical protein ACIBK9_17330 [Nonomuraea sp. NPDC050227]|uniref:hypothetical protein n=1 Tax=Nonomuraea sp. NPDC050227 TaxID=3364360 RepID=UPI0037BA63B0
MARSGIDAALSAAREDAQPRVQGKIIAESEDSLVIRAADAIIEIPMRFVKLRKERGGDNHEVVLAEDAEIVVGTIVSVKEGFIGDDVFGPLTPGVLADNCNCNCNCSSTTATVSEEAASQLRSPFVGGGARTRTPRENAD